MFRCHNRKLLFRLPTECCEAEKLCRHAGKLELVFFMILALRDAARTGCLTNDIATTPAADDGVIRKDRGRCPPSPAANGVCVTGCGSNCMADCSACLRTCICYGLGHVVCFSGLQCWEPEDHGAGSLRLSVGTIH